MTYLFLNIDNVSPIPVLILLHVVPLIALYQHRSRQRNNQHFEVRRILSNHPYVHMGRFISSAVENGEISRTKFYQGVAPH